MSASIHEDDYKLLSENLQWLCTRTKNACNRGLAIDCSFYHESLGIVVDNVPFKYALVYENNMFHVRVHNVRHKHDKWVGIAWARERVPNSYCSGPRAYPDGRVYKNSFRTSDHVQGYSMCGWSLKPSFIASTRGNKNLSMHERMKLELALDLVSRLNCTPKSVVR